MRFRKRNQCAALGAAGEIHGHATGTNRDQGTTRDLCLGIIIQSAIAAVFRSVYVNLTARYVQRAVGINAIALGVHGHLTAGDHDINIGIDGATCCILGTRMAKAASSSSKAFRTASVGGVDAIIACHHVHVAACDLHDRRFNTLRALCNVDRTICDHNSGFPVNGIIASVYLNVAVCDIDVTLVRFLIVTGVQTILRGGDGNAAVQDPDAVLTGNAVVSCGDLVSTAGDL